MTNAIESKVLEILGKGLQAVDTISAQVPEIISQLLRYNLMMNSIGTLFCIGILVGIYKVGRHVVKKDPGAVAVVMILGGATATVVLLFMLVAIFEIIKILMAPDLFILEYIERFI